jgi:hypothetical protein
MDWEALQPFLKTHAPPQVNISIDAQYPVVPAALQVQIGAVHRALLTRVHHGKTAAVELANVHGCLDRAGEIAACKNRRKS